jgi:hypothetical protein
MDPQMLERVFALLELNLLATGLAVLVYGVLLAWIIRETRLSHQALRDIAQMVRELHNRSPQKGS